MALEFKTFTAVRLHSLNVRTENHGEGLSLAADLKCTVEMPNTKLNEIDPGLLPMFYKPVETEEDKAALGELPGIPSKSPAQLPLLRSHSLAPSIALGIEYVGYQCTVDRGLGEKSNLVLGEVKVNKQTMTLKEGGTVLYGFRLQASNVSDEVIGKLSSYIKADMHIALSPPQSRQPALDGTTPASGDTVLDAGKKSAETPKAGKKPAAKKGKSAPSSDEIAKAFAEAEAKGLNKPADKVPPAPKKRSAKPSLKVATTH